MTQQDLSNILSFMKVATVEATSQPVLLDDADFRAADFLQDLGLDSLDLISLLFDVEQEYGIKVLEDDIDAKKLTVVENLANYVIKNGKG